MLRLKDTATIPPGGWRYIHRETGAVIHGQTYRELIAAVVDFHKANNFPIGLLFESAVQDQMCRAIGEGMDQFCSAVPREHQAYPLTTRKIGATEIKAFLKVMKEWAKTGEPMVSQEEAERRAEICASCPMNIEATGCRTCQGIAAYAAEIGGVRKTRLDSSLKTCSVCGCFLRVAISFPLAPQMSILTDEQRQAFPSFCWKS